MPMQYKIDVMEALKEAGYNTFVIRQQKLLSESTLQALREGRGVSWNNIERICVLLQCQPGDILELTNDTRNLI